MKQVSKKMKNQVIFDADSSFISHATTLSDFDPVNKDAKNQNG